LLLSEEYYFRFIEPDKTKLNEITFIISLDKVIGDTIYAYANAEELKNLQQLRYSIEILSHTGSLYKVEIRSSLRDLHNWDSYPTLPIGYIRLFGRGGRLLLNLVISDNVNVEEEEPEFFIPVPCMAMRLWDIYYCFVWPIIY